MKREDKAAYNYARERLDNDDYPVYSDEYELECAFKAGIEYANRWIRDELPKINPNDSEWGYSDDAIVALKDGSIAVGRYERDNSTGEHYWVLYGVDKDLVVTHWMPLPAPPKGTFSELETVATSASEKPTNCPEYIRNVIEAGKVVIGTGLKCATCKHEDEECVKLDVAGIGTMCLGDSKTTKSENNE